VNVLLTLWLGSNIDEVGTCDFTAPDTAPYPEYGNGSDNVSVEPARVEAKLLSNDKQTKMIKTLESR
jgi:hypothetical protein